MGRFYIQISKTIAFVNQVWFCYTPNMKPRNTTSHMFFYTYILESLKDGKHYTGYTVNLKRRLEEHNQGKSFATKFRKFVENSIIKDLDFYGTPIVLRLKGKDKT